MMTLDPKERYRHVTEGNSQDLHRLVISLAREAALVPGSFDAVHVSVVFADQASDHDPKKARFLVSAT
jgi:hypothetical protein